MVQPVAKSSYRKRIARRDKKIVNLEAKVKELKGFTPVQERPHFDTWLEGFQHWATGLVVPMGNDLTRGKPFVIHEFQLEFLRRCVQDQACKVGVLSVPRKNGKTMLLALTMLYMLLYEHDYWCGVIASVNSTLTEQIKKQLNALILANGIEGVKLSKSPPPGKFTYENRLIQFVASDKQTTGHSLEANIVLFDELGRTMERDRPMVNALKQALAISNGKFLAISPQYQSPIQREHRELAKEADYAVYIHHGADESDDPFDEEVWAKADPGLGTIKALEYMKLRKQEAEVSEANLPDFLAAELNLPYEPEKMSIVTVNEWILVYNDKRLENEPVYLGVDLGGSASMSCVTAIGIESGQCRFWGAWPNYRDLPERARSDGVGNLYQRMIDVGELSLYQGRRTPVGAFLRDVIDELVASGCQIRLIAGDWYREAEFWEVLTSEGLANKGVIMRVGSGKDGSYDVRAFQEAVHLKTIGCNYSPLMEGAIAHSKIIYKNGNPSLEKVATNSRVDALSASLLAVGLWKRNFDENHREVNFKKWT